VSRECAKWRQERRALGRGFSFRAFGPRFFSSINETVSIAGLVDLGSAGFAASAVVSRDLCATAACDFRAASVCDFDFVGTGTGALSVSRALLPWRSWLFCASTQARRRP